MWTNRYIGSRLKYLVLPLAFAATFGAQAEAQTVSSLMNTGTGAYFDYDGLQFTISGCTSNAAAGSSAACSGVEMEAVSQSRGSVAIEFLGNGTTYGSNALSVAAGQSNATTSFVLTVTNVASRQVTGLSAAVTSPDSIASASLPFQVNASGCTITSGSAYPYPTGNCEPYAGSGASAAVAFTPTTSLSVDYNLSVNAPSTGTNILASTTSTFSLIPEPGSFAVMASGLLFLGFASARGRHGKRAKRNSH